MGMSECWNRANDEQRVALALPNIRRKHLDLAKDERDAYILLSKTNDMNMHVTIADEQRVALVLPISHLGEVFCGNQDLEPKNITCLVEEGRKCTTQIDWKSQLDTHYRRVRMPVMKSLAQKGNLKHVHSALCTKYQTPDAENKFHGLHKCENSLKAELKVQGEQSCERAIVTNCMRCTIVAGADWNK